MYGRCSIIIYEDFLLCTIYNIHILYYIFYGSKNTTNRFAKVGIFYRRLIFYKVG